MKSENFFLCDVEIPDFMEVILNNSIVMYLFISCLIGSKEIQKLILFTPSIIKVVLFTYDSVFKFISIIMSNMYLTEQQNCSSAKVVNYYQHIVTYNFIIIIFCSCCSKNFNILLVLT
jgi:hypothetical protein